MDQYFSLLLIIVPMIVFIMIGMEIYLAMGITSIMYILFNDLPIIIFSQSLYRTLNSYDLLALPFYFLAGELMNTGGITLRLVNFSKTLIGHVRGGLSHVNILTSMVFSGVSGSAVADTSAVGSVMIPAMKKEGYSPAYSGAVTAASSIIGPIIPPSIPLVVYGLMAHVSVGRLFLAGTVPGVLMGVYLLVTSWVISRKRGYPASRRSSFKEIVLSFKNSVGALLMPLIIIVGITTGIVTPTEAGVIAVVYALILGIFVNKELKISQLPDIFGRTMINSAVVLIIISCTGPFLWIVADIGLADMLTDGILAITTNKWAILAMLMVFFLMWGCIMDAITVMLILVPILVPLITEIGIDPVHFGVILVLNLMLGLITPPVGILLFLTARLADTKFEMIVKEVLPFLAALVAVLLLCTFVPQVVLWLPDLLMPR